MGSSSRRLLNHSTHSRVAYSTASKLHTLAYNLGVFLQGTDLPEEMADCSLTSLETRLIKIGARVVSNASAITFQLAEVAISGDLFRRILTAIHGLRARQAST